MPSKVIASISLFMSFLYYTPWLLAANNFNLGLYLLAFFWFTFAWLFIVYFVLKTLIYRRKKNPEWKDDLVGLSMMVASYVIVGIGLASGVMVTV